MRSLTVTSPRLASLTGTLGMAVGVCSAVALLGGSAAAQERSVAFAIPAQPMNAALVMFATQAKLSLGGLDGQACARLSPAVRGRMTPPRALALLLFGSRCTFSFVDAATVRIALQSPAALRPAAPPPAPVPSTRALKAEPTDLAEVVVTASKRATPIQRAPYAISVVSGADLALSGTGGLGDVAGQVAGLTLTNLGSGRDKIFIRGLSDGAFTGLTQSTVALYLDDVPITYSAPDPDLLLTDIDQVEVLRGPQGTLYGAGSMGGIVRIVTRKPDLLDFGGSLSDGVATTEHGRQSHLAQAVINAPLIKGIIAVRGVAYEQVSGGYIDDVGLGLSDVNRTRRAGGRFSLTVAPRQGLTVMAGLTHQSINAADTQYAQGTLGPLQRSKSLREPHDNDFDQVFATVNASGGWGDAKVSAAYVNHDLLTRYDATGSFRAYNPAPGSPVAYDDRQQVDLTVVEANVNSPAAGQLTWLLGAFYSDSQQENDTAATALPMADAFFQTDRNDRLTEAAVYGEASYALGAHMKVTGGLRWFGSKLSAHTTASEGPVASRFDGRVNNTDISPKLVAEYSRGAWLAYAQVTQGYRIGGVNGEPHAGLAAAFPRVFQPDQLWNYEAGGSARLFEGRLRLRGAVFHADWSDLQSDQYLTSGLPITLNVGRGANTGLELEADLAPRPGLRLHGALLLQEPQLTKVRAAILARTDQGLPAVPAVAAGLTVSYAWSVAPGLQARVSADASYVGHSFITFGGADGEGEGGYTVANIAGSLGHGPWRVEAYMENVADETSNTFAHGNPFTRPNAPQATPLRPRTSGVQLTWSF